MIKILEKLGFVSLRSPVKVSSKGVLHVEPQDILRQENAKVQLRQLDRLWKSGRIGRPQKEASR